MTSGKYCTILRSVGMRIATAARLEGVRFHFELSFTCAARDAMRVLDCERNMCATDVCVCVYSFFCVFVGSHTLLPPSCPSVFAGGCAMRLGCARDAFRARALYYVCANKWKAISCESAAAHGAPERQKDLCVSARWHTLDFQLY